MADGVDRRLTAIGLGGRLLDGAASELVDSAGRLEAADAALLEPGLQAADLAHAIVLIESGVLPAAVGGRLLALLLALGDVPVADRPADPRLGDGFANREAWLAERDAEAAGWLCAGRARREGTTVAYHIAVREAVLTLAEALVEATERLVAVAAAHATTLMPDYTYLQQAQPTTLGHYLLGFAYPALRDLARLQACHARTNQSPAGIGAVNGARWPLDRQRLAELLGFDGVVTHARDAMWQADQPVEVLATATATVVNLSRLAEDLQVWSTPEFDLVELADRHARGSMIMPQKKNPYALAFVRGAASSLTGRVASAAALGRTPSGQVDNRIFLYGEVPAALALAAEAARLMGGVLAGLSVNVELMESRARAGWAQATDLAEAVIAATGIDFRSAHRVVGRLVRLADERRLTPADVTPALLDEAARTVVGKPVSVGADALAAALDPRAAVAARRGIGGAAPEAVDAMLVDCRTQLASARRWQDEARQRLAAAHTARIARARELAPSTARVARG
jgi:argininosuccinate lyase